MKKSYLSLIAALALVPATLSADNARWVTDHIKVYEKPNVKSKSKKLLDYKKYDPYDVIACDNYGWCVSKDGYVKSLVLKLKPGVRKVNFLSNVVVPELQNTEIKVEAKEESVIEEAKQEVAAVEPKKVERKVKKVVPAVKIVKKQIKTKTNLPVKAVKPNEINLTIEKLINEVVKRNANMIFDRLQRQIIDKKITFEEGVLTPSFYVNLSHAESDTPNNTEATISKGYLSTYSENTNSAQLGFKGLLSTGAKWNTAIKTNDRKSSLIEKYKDYDTEYDNSLEVSISQPILKGFGSDITLSKYHLAKADKAIFEEQFRKKLMDLMGKVIQTYWKFYGSKQLQKSYQKSVKINKQTISILEAKAKSGDIAYSEVLEAKSSLFIREAELKKMNSDVQKLKNEILTLVNVSVKANSDIKFNLIEEPNSAKDRVLTLAQYYEKAIKNWPEFAIAKKKLKKEMLQVNIAKDATKPQLDVVASASTTNLNDKRDSEFYTEEYLSWNVGLQFNVPLWDDQPQSALAMAKIKKRQVELEINTLEKGLNNAIFTKLETLNSSKKQVEYYKEGLLLKEKLYDYAQKSFNLGDKNIRDVLDQEDDIIKYQRKLFNAIIDWKLAQASLDKAVGELFSKYLRVDHLKTFRYTNLDEKLNDFSFGKM